jgi:hypothetical protein
MWDDSGADWLRGSSINRGEYMAGKKKTAPKAKKTLKGGKKVGNAKLMGGMIVD